MTTGHSKLVSDLDIANTAFERALQPFVASPAQTTEG